MQRGNALFLILIAVALFAALSYAITQSGRGGGSIGKEQVVLYAAQILQAEGEFHTAVQRMILNGTPASAIVAGDPLDTSTPGYGTENPQCSPCADFCTTGEKCLFAPEGGGLTIPSLPREAFSDDQWVSSFNGPHTHNAVAINGFSGTVLPDRAVDGAGTAANDVILEFAPLKKEVCVEINKRLGIDTDPNDMGYTNLLPVPAACVSAWVGSDGPYMYYSLLSAF